MHEKHRQLQAAWKDQFKEFNDAYGHPAGDAALRQVAAVLRANAPNPDLVSRYGGEEFSLICTGLDFDLAKDLAEEIRGQIAGTPVFYGEKRLYVTISIGIAATYLPGAAASDQLIRQADQALYAAKAEGRNCVAVGK